MRGGGVRGRGVREGGEREGKQEGRNIYIIIML